MPQSLSRRPLTILLTVAALVAALAVVGPHGAVAGIAAATPTGDDAVPEFDAPNLGAFLVGCSEATGTPAFEVLEDGSDTGYGTDDGLVVEGGGVSTDGQFRTPGLAGGDYVLVARCVVDGDPEPGVYSIQFTYYRLLLTKTVEGDAGDATFEVATECATDEGDPQAATRSFDAAGGDAVVVVYDDDENPFATQGASCTVSETDDGGATTVDVAPAVVEFDGPGDGSSTITNTFVAAEPDPEPEPDPADDTDVEDEVEEADPAEPIAADPDFTG